MNWVIKLISGLLCKVFKTFCIYNLPLCKITRTILILKICPRDALRSCRYQALDCFLKSNCLQPHQLADSEN